ncbi:integrase [Granulicella aggregans]|uniref:Integrase n=1 Tax=Granulicella aggregans TaxID=474949 RepID=A0A7W7ZKK6_9BACT|nr:integrase [Granulicella aggregans]
MTPVHLQTYTAAFRAKSLKDPGEVQPLKIGKPSNDVNDSLVDRLEHSSVLNALSLEPSGSSAAIELRRAALESEIAELRTHSLSANSQRGYAADWRNFSDWCALEGREALPASAETASLYMVDRSARLQNASLTRAIAAISRQHREAGFQSPTREGSFRQLLAGIRRKNRAPQEAKQALLVQDLFEILRQIPGLGKSEAVEHRDRALLVIGFCGALRRSELVNLDAEDIRSAPEGIILTLRWSKTDQSADGVEIGIPKGRKPATCPVTLLRAWIEYAKINTGPIFRPVQQNGKILDRRLTDTSVALIVKRHVGHAGFAAEDFSGHSLRAGLATSAAEAGQNEREIMKQTRHKSEKMVRRYIRKGSLFQGNVVGELGF